MRLISQSELLRATKLEFHALLRRIAADLPPLPEGSHELRIAHNLHNIRVALARARIPAAIPGSILASAASCRNQSPDCPLARQLHHRVTHQFKEG